MSVGDAGFGLVLKPRTSGRNTTCKTVMIHSSDRRIWVVRDGDGVDIRELALRLVEQVSVGLEVS